MTKHTPGPWTYHGGFGQCVKAGLNVVAECRKPPLNPAECEANAVLISAAPDLLAAAKLVQEFFECIELNSLQRFAATDCKRLIEAAVRKAEK